MNQQLEAELGIPASAALGKTGRELGFPEHSVSLLEETLRTTLRDGQNRAVEYSLPTPRSLREYEGRVAPERGPDGKVETFLVISRNITQRKESERALADRTQQLEAVRAIRVEITHEPDLDRLLALIVRRAVELVGSAAGAVILRDDATQSLVPRACHGCRDQLAAFCPRLGEGLTGTVAAQRRGMLVTDYATSPHAHLRALEHAPIAAALAEPLLYQDRLLGVLVLYHVESGRTFTEQHQSLLALLATQAAIAIENARLFAACRRILLVDGEPRVRATIAEMLRSMRHAVTEAEDAVAGLARLAEHQLDLALTDLGTPGMSGSSSPRRSSGARRRCRWCS